MVPEEDYERLRAENHTLQDRVASLEKSTKPSVLATVGDGFAYLWSQHKTDICIAAVAVAGPIVHAYFPTAPQVDPVVLQRAVDEAVKRRDPPPRLETPVKDDKVKYPIDGPTPSVKPREQP